MPSLLCFTSGIEIGDVLLAELSERINDPVTLAFNAAGSVAKGGGALCSVD